LSVFDKLFVRADNGDPKDWRALERRIRSMRTDDLPSWAEQSLYAIGRNLIEYRKDPSRPEFLDEAVDGSRVVVRLIEEYRRRLNISG